jgi:tetratricopeptide repeat protein 21B
VREQAYGLLLEEAYIEALKCLESLKQYRELEVAVLAAMIYAHQHCKVVDEDQVHNLGQCLELAEKNINEKGLLFAATLYWHLGGHGNLQKAQEFVGR